MIKKVEYDSTIYIGVAILEISTLHTYDVLYNIPKPSLKDLQLHYMDADGFVLWLFEGKVSDGHMEIVSLDTPEKTNEKLTVKFKYEFGSKLVEEFVNLSPKTYCFNYCGKRRAKEKGIKKCNNAKHEDYYNALMYDIENCRGM